MFAVFFILLTMAAAFGTLVFAAAITFAFIPALRPWGKAIGAGGLFGALATFCLFALFAVTVEHGREPVFSTVPLVFSAAGFGAGGVFGAVLFGIVRFITLARIQQKNRGAAG